MELPTFSRFHGSGQEFHGSGQEFHGSGQEFHIPMLTR